MIEFLPWYVTGASMVRCEGDDGCGALLLEADTERHVRWHKRIESIELLGVQNANHRVLGK